VRGDIWTGEKPQHGNLEATRAAARGKKKVDGLDEGDDSSYGKGWEQKITWPLELDVPGSCDIIQADAQRLYSLQSADGEKSLWLFIGGREVFFVWGWEGEDYYSWVQVRVDWGWKNG